jgi:phosphoenolpyruvate-protein phosphotransferase
METIAIRGIAASPGIAIGSIRRYETQSIVVEKQHIDDVQQELARLDTALAQARLEVQALAANADQHASAKEAAIFEAHEMFLNDPDLLEQVQATIKEHVDAAYAWQEGMQFYKEQIEQIDDEYLSARVTDIEDVKQRVLRLLVGDKAQGLHLQEPAIIVATELTPSMTMQFDKNFVLAFCTATGGATSHVAILAKALGIPAVIGLGTAIDHLHDHTQVIVDGNSGEILLSPDQETLTEYQNRQQEQTKVQQQAFKEALKPAYTLDGQRHEIVANVGAPEQAADALTNGAEGIGLLRTEFLFMDRESAPDEEEQYKVYHTILETMEQRPVVIRTLDIGGDKPAPYIKVPAEMNPFLGIRGIRLTLAQPALLQTQLRALLRASVGHQLRIMFPMVSSREEIAAIRQQIQIAQEALAKESIVPAANIQIGIMIEVPAAAVMADVLAKYVDFFSIGTNDLTQYTLAVDRTNEAAAPLADALHPAVLRLIHTVIEAAHKRQRWVGLCGELAGNPLAIPVLLGLGLDEFSMSANAIPVSKQLIRRYSSDEAAKIAQEALNKENAATVRAYLTEVTRLKAQS